MDGINHDLSDLFLQLGLPSEQKDIDAFINQHGPLDRSIPLEEARFWNKSQKAFLTQQLQADADWAEPVDQLNTLLR